MTTFYKKKKKKTRDLCLTSLSIKGRIHCFQDSRGIKPEVSEAPAGTCVRRQLYIRYRFCCLVVRYHCATPCRAVLGLPHRESLTKWPIAHQHNHTKLKHHHTSYGNHRKISDYTNECKLSKRRMRACLIRSFSNQEPNFKRKDATTSLFFFLKFLRKFSFSIFSV